MTMTGGELAFIVIVGAVLATSVVCNVLVMVVVAVTPKLRTPTNVLICNLAVSDLLLASVVLPQNLHDVSHAEDSYDEGDFLCRVVHTSPLFCITASIYTMVAISFDRTAAIVLNALRKLTCRSVSLQLLSIWVLSVLLCAPTLYEFGEFVVVVVNGTVLGCGSHGVSHLYSVLNGVGLLLLAYLLPVAVVMVNYGRILVFFRSKGVLGGGSGTGRGEVFQALYKSRMMVVKMLILVALLFALSWAPYFVLLLTEKVSGTSHNQYSDDWANMLRIALSAFSTAYNFLLYVVYNRNFRLGLQRLLGIPQHCRLLCKRGSQVAPSDHVQDDDFDVTQTARELRAAQPTVCK
ncbi:neuromedin-K receptor-like [Babylonia areolata]|uniref:neuromedin-K receptor-like n=1 Tax=Babylonia areolata TaxID=304850 RepID=UPI003FCF1BDB